MPDTTDQGALALRGKCLKRRVARFSIGARHANFDQFVIMQGSLRFGDNTRTHPGIADEDDRLEGVGEAAQVAALFFC